MAITQNTYTGNGSTVLYSFTFPYLETTDIKVSLNGVDTTAYTLANATTVQFNSAPANGAAIRIYRQTDDTSTKATFFPGSAIRSQDLNDNFLQVLYKSQETETFAAATDASAIQATANTALANSNTAITTANAASATANGIAGTANTAVTNSNAAVSTANTASSNASAAQATANAALPKTGGTMTGNITFNAGQTFPSSGITAGTTSIPGIVQLTDSTSSTSTTTAATPNAVKSAFDSATSAQTTANNAAPPGTVQFYAVNTPPTGWLKANGAEISRITYAALFAAIGTTFGAGDGSTTFTLPDLRGEFLRGWDDGRGVDTSRGFGSTQAQAFLSHTHTGGTAASGSHSHSGITTTAGSHSHTSTGAGTSGSPVYVTKAGDSGDRTYTTNPAGDHAHSLSIDAGGSHSHTFTTDAQGGTETRPRNVALLAIIKY